MHHNSLAAQKGQASQQIFDGLYRYYFHHRRIEGNAVDVLEASNNETVESQMQRGSLSAFLN